MPVKDNNKDKRLDRRDDKTVQDNMMKMMHNP